jgi:hypothetical protein
MHPGACKAFSAVSTGCENIPKNKENNENNEKMNELKGLEAEAAKLAKAAQYEGEWIRLSIVEKTALMGAYKDSYHGAKGDLSGAKRLFMEIKENEARTERNIKNNYLPYQEKLEREIKALKLELRTPEQVASDEQDEERRLARLRMFQD